MLERVSGRKVKRPIYRAWREEIPWLRPAPDGVLLARSGPPSSIELKTCRDISGWAGDGQAFSSDDALGDALNDVTPIAPRHYLLQAALGAFCQGLDVAILAGLAIDWLSWRRELRIVTVTDILASERLQHLIEHIAVWRDRYLVGDEEPPSPSAARLAEIDRDGCRAVEADGAEEQLIAELRAARQTAEEASARAHRLGLELMELIGPNKSLRSPTWLATVVCQAGRDSVAASKVRKDAPDIWDLLVDRGLITHGRPNAHVRVSASQAKKKKAADTAAGRRGCAPIPPPRAGAPASDAGCGDRTPGGVRNEEL